jgi:hypothetical protein
VLPVKKTITELLKKQSYQELSDVNASHHKKVNVLISLSYNKETDLSWRAIEAIGIMSKQAAESDPETVRNTVGRLLWMLRDESGGIGWSAPEMLGEIVKNNPELCADIAPIILSFHYEHMLTAGTLRATGRIGKINEEMIAYAIPIILPYLNSTDNSTRGYAVYALGELGAIGAKVRLEGFENDKGKFLFYDEGSLKEISVGDMASNALIRLNA